MNAILKGRFFASIANRLKHYIASIKIIGKEEKATPCKFIVAQLQSHVEAMPKSCSADKSEIVKATFKRLLEEQIKLREEAQRRKDAQRAQLNEIQSTGNIVCAKIESAIGLAKSQDQAIA